MAGSSQNSRNHAISAEMALDRMWYGPKRGPLTGVRSVHQNPFWSGSTSIPGHQRPALNTTQLSQLSDGFFRFVGFDAYAGEASPYELAHSKSKCGHIISLDNLYLR